jgi:hypothetical protein
VRVAVISDTHGRQNWVMPACDVSPFLPMRSIESLLLAMHTSMARMHGTLTPKLMQGDIGESSGNQRYARSAELGDADL